MLYIVYFQSVLFHPNIMMKVHPVHLYFLLIALLKNHLENKYKYDKYEYIYILQINAYLKLDQYFQ